MAYLSRFSYESRGALGPGIKQVERNKKAGKLQKRILITDFTGNFY
jgi:hypothetical protein